MSLLATTRAAVVAALADAHRIGVLGHIGPDGDALGSVIALARAARAAGKDAHASFGEPFVVPKQFSFLDVDVLTPPAQLPTDLDVVVACDTAAPERLGSALPAAQRAGSLVIIDHHLSNGGFGDIVLIDSEAASTAQLVYQVIVDLGWPLDVDTATALYVGLVTDTGRFQYSLTNQDVHRIAGELLARGVRPEVVGRHVYEEAPFGYLRVAGAVLSRAQLDETHRLVWSELRAADLALAEVAYQDTDGLIDLIRLAEEAEVACLLKELEPGVIKGSLRSRGEIDVAAVAAGFGGGGHHNAAGFTFHGTVEEAVARIQEALG
jgi:phosphoesterase RecJ-like protein